MGTEGRLLHYFIRPCIGCRRDGIIRGRLLHYFIRPCIGYRRETTALFYKAMYWVQKGWHYKRETIALFFFKKPTENKKPQSMNDITVKAVHTEL